MKRIFLGLFLLCAILTILIILHPKKTQVARNSHIISTSPSRSLIYGTQNAFATAEPTDAIRTEKDSTTTMNSEAWYSERNLELSEIIRENNPSYSEEQIQRYVSSLAIDPDKPMVALSFDDGPTPGVTDQILDILQEYNARATFFVCGWRLERENCKDILRRISSLGCEVGNHTWSHNMLADQNYVSVRYEIENTNKIVFEITGVYPRCFRPPGGRNSYDAIRVTQENDMVIVLWQQSGNVHEKDPSKIAQNIEKQLVDGKELQNGDVILLHDRPSCMVDAVKIIVPRLIEEGYQLVTVWELINCSGEEIVPGAVYQAH